MIDIEKLPAPALRKLVEGLRREVSELRSAEQTSRVGRNKAVRVLRLIVEREARRTAMCLGCGQSDGHWERCEVEDVIKEGS